MAQKPSIPKGTRDFTPQEMANRNYIFNTIKDVFRLYGFQQIETPAMENLSTLMGKYGEEGDKLLFKVLNSGDYLDALDAKTRGLTKKELKSLSQLDDNEFIESISFVKERLISTKKYKKIEKDFIEEFTSSPKEHVGKFIFYSSSKVRTYLELKKFISNLTHRKLRQYINSALRQSRLSDLKSSSKLTLRISEKGLRYDLTVPFARFVVQHQNEIKFPFKRYQIQPVWRADKPQRGRYREFYQCDVDVVGSDSLLNELELIQIVDEVYRRLKINVVIKINNRKILSGIAEIIGEAEKITDITVAIDKMDKIGLEKVNEEIASKGISEEAIAKLQPILKLSGSNAEKLEQLKVVLAASEVGLKGVMELETIFGLCETMKVATKIDLDLTLARGLNYYTGAIFEVKALDVEMGSITGGGRYDNLTGVFGMEGVSGVGISFGADRIYDVLNTLNLYPETSLEHTQILFISISEKELMYSLPYLQRLRMSGINAEIYPEATRNSNQQKKPFTYADNKRIPFVAIVGETEMDEGKVLLKNLKTGEQSLSTIDEVIQLIK